jgi:AraC-like DNA-binding protein
MSTSDPLAEVVTLLQPAARFSKLVECGGSWRIHPVGTCDPFYCGVLEGVCTATVDGQAMTLQAGDFVLVPAMRKLVHESTPPPADGVTIEPVEVSPGRFRVGEQDSPVVLRMQVGHCSFASPDAELLISLLPQMVIARGEPRLAVLLRLIDEETRAWRSAKELVLQRLLEVMLIEAFRCGMDAASAPGLARGLTDERLAIALRAIHARPEHGWTVAKLAKDAALSRSAFFARFSRTLGVPPMEYLLSWRMALAKRRPRDRELSMEEVAASVGYSSASTFTVAFARHVGMPPARYARTM